MTGYIFHSRKRDVLDERMIYRAIEYPISNIAVSMVKQLQERWNT